MILFFLLEIFIVWGLFKGQKWSIILLVILYGFGTIGAIFQIQENIVSAIVNVVLLIFTVQCWRHLFYGKKRVSRKEISD